MRICVTQLTVILLTETCCFVWLWYKDVKTGDFICEGPIIKKLSAREIYSINFELVIKGNQNIIVFTLKNWKICLIKYFCDNCRLFISDLLQDFQSIWQSFSLIWLADPSDMLYSIWHFFLQRLFRCLVPCMCFHALFSVCGAKKSGIFVTVRGSCQSEGTLFCFLDLWKIDLWKIHINLIYVTSLDLWKIHINLIYVTSLDLWKIHINLIYVTSLDLWKIHINLIYVTSLDLWKIHIHLIYVTSLDLWKIHNLIYVTSLDLWKMHNLIYVTSLDLWGKKHNLIYVTSLDLWKIHNLIYVTSLGFWSGLMQNWHKF